MRSGRVSDVYAHAWLEELAAVTTHIGLGSADPYGVMDPLTVEPTGGVYHRCAADLIRTDNLLRNAEDLIWPGLPIGAVITWYIGWDAAFNGNVTFVAPSPVLSFPTGGGFRVAAGNFFFGLGW